MKKFLFFCIMLFFFLSCKEKKKKVKIEPWTKPILSTYNSISMISDSARVTARIRGKVADRYENNDLVYPEGIFMEFFDKNEKTSMTVKADSAFYRHSINDYVAVGNVKVIDYVDGNELDTEELHWNKKKKTIFTDKKVKITSDQQIINGKGLEAKQDFSDYTIKKVTGSLYLEEDQ